MAEHEYPYLEKPERLEFPTETWAAQDIRKSDVLHYAVLHASGTDRALYDERARFFHRHSVESLAGMPTRTLARPVVVLLTCGFLHSWRLHHPQAAEPAPKEAGDFGHPSRFVPQRIRATRRAIQLALGLAAGIVLAAAAWFLR
jgi:hypothetical protein